MGRKCPLSLGQEGLYRDKAETPLVDCIGPFGFFPSSKWWLSQEQAGSAQRRPRWIPGGKKGGRCPLYTAADRWRGGLNHGAVTGIDKFGKCWRSWWVVESNRTGGCDRILWPRHPKWGLEKEGLFSMLESVGQGNDREIGHDAIASLWNWVKPCLTWAQIEICKWMIGKPVNYITYVYYVLHQYYRTFKGSLEMSFFLNKS